MNQPTNVNKPQKINILGVEFDNLTFGQAVSRAAELTERGGYCVTPNPEIVWMARRDTEFSKVVNSADLVIADGIGIVYAAKLRKTPVAEKIPGIDVASAVLAKLSENESNRGVFLFGAKPGVTDKAANNLTDKYPTLCIAGTQDGYNYDTKELQERIFNANPAIILVCLGAPKQEMWIRDYIARYPEQRSLLIGLGGALDAFAGTVRRAPESWRRLNLEWLYRLLKQPTRIKRMLVLPKFLLTAMFSR
ncbi:MAG: WecB/TagA/CpsF family glycosyltransferase [Oscillospiraceae bacterium]|nr:WecB/TagA/CpsF family glycosyltransferase [Oscillospiraceae bacterium]